jgi:phosphatidylglycerol---prolipoprotein diacylglyceryl transferase
VFPIALRLGELPITWYGVLAATGFFVGVRFAIGSARRDGLSPVHVEWLAFWVIVAGVVGSRALFVLTQLPHFAEHPAEVFLPRKGGLVFLGGLLAAIAVGALYMRLRKLPLLRYADAVAPGVALGHAIGRLGCLAVGCCYGAPAADLPWAVRFPQSDWEQIAPVGVPLHPVQLYELATNLAIFALLLALRPRRRFVGQVGLSYLALYSAARIVLEVFRGDGERGFVWESALGEAVSTSQFTSAAVLFAALVTCGLLWRRAGAASGSTPR